MTEHGWERDDWPDIFDRVMDADILVLGTPIWLGEKSSVCTHVIERLYGNSHILNEHCQYAYYGKVGGCLVTGNEDGIKHCSMNILYALQHLVTRSPTGRHRLDWRGRARPLVPRRGIRRPQQRLHQSKHDLHDVEPPPPRPGPSGRGWIPGPCNQRSGWDAGSRYDFPNPEYR